MVICDIDCELRDLDMETTKKDFSLLLKVCYKALHNFIFKDVGAQNLLRTDCF